MNEIENLERKIQFLRQSLEEAEKELARLKEWKPGMQIPQGAVSTVVA